MGSHSYTQSGAERRLRLGVQWCLRSSQGPLSPRNLFKCRVSAHGHGQQQGPLSARWGGLTPRGRGFRLISAFVLRSPFSGLRSPFSVLCGDGAQRRGPRLALRPEKNKGERKAGGGGRVPPSAPQSEGPCLLLRTGFLQPQPPAGTRLGPPSGSHGPQEFQAGQRLPFVSAMNLVWLVSVGRSVKIMDGWVQVPHCQES